ncbi:MAG: hypothetical protein R2695_12515 [Acidimicrobiales bacterium]
MANEDPLEDTEDMDDLDDEIDDDEIDDDEFDEDGGEEFDLGDDDGVAEDDDEEDDVPAPSRPPSDEDDDEDDDDVEADLDAILKDRIAAGDDEDDDEDDDGTPARTGATPSGEAEPVIARQANEFSCPHCFLLVNRKAVLDGECPHCGGPVDVP